MTSPAASEAIPIDPSPGAVRRFPHHAHCLEFGPMEREGDKSFVMDGGERIEVQTDLGRCWAVAC
jgi:hypothetical protein